ncbi:EamA family transporter [Microvirga sp. SYSU G3D207]|uniref:EamA family transporter n=1 Tax=Microvirga arsenatis TaxID=2692265 RepID=A0ABW9Z2R7_9HYPH|nr:DMT family transporter [Microvirga arsenatis]NBJ12004.1 EamA family transporter [Microvirga arsenatis]NBJ26005.1 EamA family transporter [Microvirga arsenatis]
MAAAATGVQVGAALVASRFVIHEIGPASLAFLRYCIAVLCLVPLLLIAERARIAPRDLIAVMTLGIVQFGILIALLNLGLQFISSTRAALLFATFPLMTMIIAALLGRERLTSAKAAGVVLTIVGVGIALGEPLFAGTAAGEWIGALLVLAAAFSGAVCSVLYRPYLARYPTLPVGAWAMLASVAFLSVPAGMEGLYTQPSDLTMQGILAVIFIGLSSGIGYVLWLWALKNTTPTRVTVFLSLSPITAAVLGALILSEPFTPGILVGLIGVAGGLWLATRPSHSLE